jgi:uridylate kinase
MPSPPTNRKIVLRIGGSVLGSPPQAKLLRGYAEVISEARKTGLSIGVVVGGGPVSRAYIATAKELLLPREGQDMIAIDVSRLNAKLVGMKLGVKRVSTTTQGMMVELEKNGIGVMGGLRPGITTDTVAAILGDAWHSDLLVKASDQDGVYTADPRTDKEAKLLHNLSYQELVRILGGAHHRPGIHSIVDPVAAKFIAKHKLSLVVTNGFFPSNVRKALLGERVGTLVT